MTACMNCTRGNKEAIQKDLSNNDFGKLLKDPIGDKIEKQFLIPPDTKLPILHC